MHMPSLNRRRFLGLSGAAAATALFARSITKACPALEIPPSDDAMKLAKSINSFACDMHTRLTKEDKGTQFFSPFSIETALAMTSAGARGKTLDEMLKTLHLPADPHSAFSDLLTRLNGPALVRARSFQLSTANAIWAHKNYPWHKEFMDLTHKFYGAGLVETDFGKPEAARKEINTWVEKETHEKIKELIPQGVITGLTRMVLANAIYFKGNWQYKFDPKLTQNAPFTHVDGTKADVPLMAQQGEYGYGEMTMFVRREGEKVQILDLPYTGGELSMRLYLPEDPGGAERLAKWLNGKELDNVELESQKVAVYLPRFKAESKYSLKPVLMDLGMRSPFEHADFTGMSPRGQELFISHVLHKAFVDVNEEGTEAAAATAVVIKREAASSRQILFRADRPFVFTIRDNKTGMVLFMGRYGGPAANQVNSEQ
jgi:serpin B